MVKTFISWRSETQNARWLFARRKLMFDWAETGEMSL